MGSLLEKAEEFGKAADLLHESKEYFNNVETQETYYACYLRIRGMFSTYILTEECFISLQDRSSSLGIHAKSFKTFRTILLNLNIMDKGSIYKIFRKISFELRTRRNNAAYNKNSINNEDLKQTLKTKKEIFDFCKKIEYVVKGNNNFPKIESIVIESLRDNKTKWTLSFDGQKDDEIFSV
jgi:uncharacterized protein (UPF0332 family)